VRYAKFVQAVQITLLELVVGHSTKWSVEQKCTCHFAENASMKKQSNKTSQFKFFIKKTKIQTMQVKAAKVTQLQFLLMPNVTFQTTAKIEIKKKQKKMTNKTNSQTIENLKFENIIKFNIKLEKRDD